MGKSEKLRCRFDCIFHLIPSFTEGQDEMIEVKKTPLRGQKMVTRGFLHIIISCFRASAAAGSTSLNIPLKISLGIFLPAKISLALPLPLHIITQAPLYPQHTSSL